MPCQDTKILEFNQYQISGKTPFVIYGDLEYVIENTDGCKNKPKNSITTKVSEHISSDISMSTISSFRSIETMYDVYKGKDCVKNFCKSAGQQAMKMINFKKKKN